ncbi:MAG TPA: Hsp20/alpha crystallin family protein [Candidatus Paceibacterota bacterium]|nr:Hsp20/alpha crystallin family protein [Candidatus Paceibacterota bacterium]
MPIIKWEPFSDLEHFFEDRPYISMFPKLEWDLAIGVFEKDGNLVATMNLPGVNADELVVVIGNNQLTISGMHEDKREVDEKNYHSKEIRRGSFTRTIDLPKAVDDSRTDAVYKGGVLTVTMPVIVVEKKEQQSKTIEVKKT